MKQFLLFSLAFAEMQMQNNNTMEASPMNMEHHHGRPILESPHLEPQQRRYWEQYNTTTFFNHQQGSKFNLYTHAALAFTSFGLLAPATVLISNDNNAQWLYIPVYTVQTILSLTSFFFLMLYSVNAPKLYENNVYSKFTILMACLCVVHWVALIVKSISQCLKVDGYELQNFDEFELTPRESNEFSDTEVSSMESVHNKNESLHIQQPPKIVKVLSENKVFAYLNNLLGGITTLVYNLLNYPLFVLGWGYMMTGLATGFLMGKDWRIFALLAHFIKGWVFFALGFIELARFFGAGAQRGWAWNQVILENVESKSLLSKVWPANPTIEFVQSFLIFFYGSTNVFLEHLGNHDGVWSHKDLQHASIAFMFFGGGLCGMILESKTVHSLIGSAFGFNVQTTSNKVVRGYSINPMPAFIIFWTGALMSHHQQETELSTQIHIQWGYLFSLAAVLRLITLALLLTKPKVDSKEAEIPQRPFSELLVSFCLVCGGMIFMASNRETVEGMIYRGIDQMFTMNVSVGVTVLLISYFTLCLAVKGWAGRRY